MLIPTVYGVNISLLPYCEVKSFRPPPGVGNFKVVSVPHVICLDRFGGSAAGVHVILIRLSGIKMGKNLGAVSSPFGRA